MYLDKPMKDHSLLQAICRTNRTFGQEKTHGLIVDYIGIFDDVAQALDFDEKAVQQVVSNIEELRQALPVQVQKCLAFFSDVDRSVGGLEGLMAAQQCLPNNEVRDKFAGEYNDLGGSVTGFDPESLRNGLQVESCAKRCRLASHLRMVGERIANVRKNRRKRQIRLCYAVDPTHAPISIRCFDSIGGT